MSDLVIEAEFAKLRAQVGEVVIKIAQNDLSMGRYDPAIDEALRPAVEQRVAEYVRGVAFETFVDGRVDPTVVAAVDAATARHLASPAISQYITEGVNTILTDTLQSKREEIVAHVVRLVADQWRDRLPSLVPVLDATGNTIGAERTHSQFEYILKLVASRAGNVLMVGPAGSGKTQIAQHIATVLGWHNRFYYNGSVQSEYKLLGFRDASGIYRDTPFFKAYTQGGVYLFDEIDASSAQCLVTFNTALGNRTCDFPGHHEPVPAHDDFICMAAANTYGRDSDKRYVGRNPLDAATLDRFIFVRVDYDTALEYATSNNDKWVDAIQGWRKAMNEKGTRHVISTRACQIGAKLLAAGLAWDDVQEMVVWKGLDHQKVQEIKQAAGVA
jgi:hypothetical protein